MPKHRRKKNQRKNKSNNNNKGNKKAGKRKPGEEEDLGKSNETATGTDPEIESVDDIKAEGTQTIERSVSAGCSGGESKIANDKLNASDSEKSILESGQFESNFANFLDSCRVTKSLKSAIGNHTSKTGATNSKEQEAGEPSPPSPRELLEIRKSDSEHENDVLLHSSSTSSSLSSSDSDTLKADGDSPDREVPNVLEMESHDMHDVTDFGDCGYDSSVSNENKTSEKSKNATSSSRLEGFEEPAYPSKPIRHPIVQEVITTLYPYRVESPKPMKSKTAKEPSIKKSRSLDDDDVMIQEISDNSSAGDLTDNQPVVSEAESETDSSELLDACEKSGPRILSITTIPLESAEPADIKTQEFTSSKEIENNDSDNPDFKSRRAIKRAALETHFMPQFLNPRYLDSIKEECSDMSDIDKKSDSEILSNPSSPSVRDFEDDDVFSDSGIITKKANAVFPKSNLDFSHKHKPVSHLRPPKTGVIREEPPCVVVEAKIVEQESIEESCSTWTTQKIQESGAAEVVYLDSASSSSSDLMDLDYTQGNDADIEDSTDEPDVHIETPTIEVDGETIFNSSTIPTAAEDQQNQPPSEAREEISSSPTPVVLEKQAADEIIENLTESCDHRRIYERSASDHVAVDEKFSENNPDKVLSGKQFDCPAVSEYNSCSKSSYSECIQIRTDFKVGEPCSNTMFASLLSPLISDKENSNKFDSVNNEVLDGNQDSTGSNRELTRQDSSGSHGSGQSHSTVHSQCTAINKDSLTHADMSDFADIGSCISGSPIAASLLESSADTATKTLRQLCIEALASMPYGKDILEELASVAESLSHLTQQHQEKKYLTEVEDMPYPIPELPRIHDLEVPAREEISTAPPHVKLMAVPPSKSKSPDPPPVPELPKESSWLGLPTEKDPNVLVCLSPSQRSYLKETNSFADNSADTLLDMHKKFVERRGYHELSTQQVNNVHREKSEQVVSSTQLRNSVTPPPIPPPPLPQSFIENETVTSANCDDDDDKNNHRLLAIIRDSKQSSSENTSRKIEQAEKSESVSVPKTQRGDQETQTTKTATTTTTATGTATIAGSKDSEKLLADEEGRDNKMPQPQLDRESFFKSLDHENPFKGEFKRFSSIETTPSYCGQLMQTIPKSKRYSNIETASYESRKRIENGKVVYEFCDSNKEKFTDDADKEKGEIGSTRATANTEIMSDAKLESILRSAKAPTDQRSEFTQSFKNSKSENERGTNTKDFSYDEFRQRAKETARNAKSEFFKKEKLLKDFEDIEKFFNDDLLSMSNQEQKKNPKTFEIPVKFQSKTDMWDALDKKIQQQEQQKEVKRETKTYENWNLKTEGNTGAARNRMQQNQKSTSKSYEIPIKIESKTDPWEEFDRKIRRQQEQKKQTQTHRIPFQMEKDADPWKEFDKLRQHYEQTHQEREQKKGTTYEIPVKIEKKTDTVKAEGQRSQTKSTQSQETTQTKERVVPIKIEERPRPASTSHFEQYSSSFSNAYYENKLSEKRLSSHNLDEWMKYADLGASSDNITKPFMKEMEIVCQGRRANVKAPRLTASTSNLHTSGRYDDSFREYDTQKSTTGRHRYMSCQSMIDQTPITQYVSPHFVRRSSLPKELHDNQVDYIKQKEHDLQVEFDRLEHDRRRLIEEMDKMHANHKLRKDVYQHRSCRLPTLSEEEAFRQQMHDEWMNKVAEREERRLHKIIKISKPADELESGAPQRPVRKSSSSIDISDEFLKRVKERRSKLQMPSDSDWESGAESQPTPKPQTDGQQPSVKVIEGQQEADLRQLPKHLREFAELTSKFQEEHSEETSSYKTSTMTKTDGIWSPRGRTATTTKESKTERTSSTGHPILSPPTPPPPPVWSPQPSPTPGRKEFRPVKFESPVLQRKYVRQDSAPVAPPPWSYTSNQPFSGYQSLSCSNLNTTGSEKRSFSSTSDIPQKFKDCSHGKGASYTETERPKIPKDDTPAFLRPNEVIYSVKHEYMSEPESENDRPKKMAQLGRRQFEGIGPTTKDGMPIVLRSEVKENNQHQWYKRMYNTLHKAKDGDEYVTISYKTRRGRYPYKSNGYMSEPEPSYDSDYSTMKYSTLDRRRTPSTGTYDDRNYGTMPNPVKSALGSYKNQPGRIEDYIPGRSSVSEKEKKEWWDEVMDIFNGHLEQQKLSNNYAEGYLSRALKEQGYESDSNLVFRKKEESRFAPLSPVEQRQAYRSVQAGGEPPLQGFRKLAPEKPKETDVVPPLPPTKGSSLFENGQSQESPHRYFETDVNIHYKTPIRYEYKEAIPEEELARRQAETMKKLYQEERRRKYLQELQDMNSRRHTDNFTSTQKSPIPLNRFDDFTTDVSPKSPGSSPYPKTVARALYNFQGQTARELTFKKGDVIYIRRQIDKNWYEGEHNAMIGLLPANYVEIISKDGVRQPPKKPSEGQARAKFNFQAQSAIELSLNKGELVTLTRRVDENWFEGKIANRKGIFPVSYVEVLTDIGADDYSPTRSKPVGAPASHSLITYPNTASHDTLRTNLNNEFNSITGGQPANGVLRETKTVQKTEVLHVDTNSEPIAYRALYKYRPQNNDELELHEGDIVYVLEKCDDGWYVGTSQRTGYFGTFPGNYVERV